MPQLDQSTWVSQLFWLAITFGALWLFVRGYVAPRLQTIVGKRESAIAGDLELAEAARRKTSDLEAEHAREIADAHERARETLSGAQTEIGRKTGARTAQTRGEIEARLDAAKTRIEAAKASALGELDAIAADAAREIVRRVAGLEVNDAAARAAIAEARS